MTLNNIFDIEKKESLVSHSTTASLDEKRRAEKDRQEAAVSLAGFQKGLASRIASEEQSQAVYSEVSSSDTAVGTILKIRKLIRSGMAETGTKLDQDTITVLEGSIRDFDQEIKISAVQ